MLIDHAPDVLAALKNGPVKQTDLTEAVFGSSGRGNPHLVNSLFPFCVRKGWVSVAVKGRTKTFTLTDAGRAAIGESDPHANWDKTRHDFTTGYSPSQIERLKAEVARA